MKPPASMPLPWQVGVCHSKYGLDVDFEYEGKFNSLSCITMKDQKQAVAYIQHCVNDYPSLVDLLSHIRDWCEEHGKEPFWLVYVEEALRKAGEL